MTVFFVSLLSEALSSSFTNNFLLFGQTPIASWVKWVFYIALTLASVGFCVVLTLQIKSFINKEKLATKEKTWESVWTAVPLIVLIALWWFF